jgi:hypothetical protein
MFAGRPLHPGKRTCGARLVMSQKGQKETSAVAGDPSPLVFITNLRARQGSS